MKAIVCLGTDNKKLSKAFKDVVEQIVETSSAEEAVQASYKLGKKRRCSIVVSGLREF